MLWGGWLLGVGIFSTPVFYFFGAFALYPIFSNPFFPSFLANPYLVLYSNMN